MDSTTSDMFINSRRPKKNRIRVNTTSSTGDLIMGINTSPVSTKNKNMLSPPPVVMMARKVPVLYYLARNAHIEHPHLIHVPLSSPYGLYLRDVMNTLNSHRGKGMANMYSWSFKRSYKNGYVWNDLSEDDLIEATNGNDYVLKGSELLQAADASQVPTQKKYSGEDCSSTTAAAMGTIRRRNQSWSSFDNPQEYIVVKCESSRELAAKFAGADAATQTGEQRGRQSFEREEIPSPPPSNSSSEVSEGVNVRQKDVTEEDQHGRMKASEVLMQLITCGAPSRLKM